MGRLYIVLLIVMLPQLDTLGEDESASIEESLDIGDSAGMGLIEVDVSRPPVGPDELTAPI